MNKEVALIENLLKNLCDKEYSKSNACLKQIVSEKIKTRIKKALKDKKDKSGKVDVDKEKDTK